MIVNELSVPRSAGIKASIIGHDSLNGIILCRRDHKVVSSTTRSIVIREDKTSPAQDRAFTAGHPTVLSLQSNHENQPLADCGNIGFASTNEDIKFQ